MPGTKRGASAKRNAANVDAKRFVCAKEERDMTKSRLKQTIAVKKYIPARIAMSFQSTRRCQSSQIAPIVPTSGTTTPITAITCLSRLVVIFLCR